MAQSISPKEIAVSYLVHEFRKLFAHSISQSVWNELEQAINKLPTQLGERDFWQLISGISEGFKLKWIYRILTNDMYVWTREQLPLNQVRLTGMGPEIDPLLKQGAEGKPEHFAELYRKDEKFRKAVVSSFRSHNDQRDPVRESDPIMVREVKGRFSVFDGMRRTIFATIDGKKTIDAFVGREKKKSGKMMVNPDKPYFLSLLYQESRNRRSLRPHFVAIAREIIKQTRNGYDVWKDRIAGWSDDKELKDVVDEILHKR